MNRVISQAIILVGCKKAFYCGVKKMVMKVHEVVSLNGELLKKLHGFGIKTEDYKFVQMFEDYKVGVAAGHKVTYLVAKLAEAYGVSQRFVYKLVNFFSQDCTLCAVQ